MEASRCAYKRNIIQNSLRQHNCFITQVNYIDLQCIFYKILLNLLNETLIPLNYYISCLILYLIRFLFLQHVSFHPFTWVYVITLSNKVVVLTYTIEYYSTFIKTFLNKQPKPNLMEIRQVGAALMHVDRRTDITNLTGVPLLCERA